MQTGMRFHMMYLENSTNKFRNQIFTQNVNRTFFISSFILLTYLLFLNHLFCFTLGYKFYPIHISQTLQPKIDEKSYDTPLRKQKCITRLNFVGKKYIKRHTILANDEMHIMVLMLRQMCIEPKILSSF